MCEICDEIDELKTVLLVGVKAYEDRKHGEGNYCPAVVLGALASALTMLLEAQDPGERMELERCLMTTLFSPVEGESAH